jgi:DNA-binding GntR family transcriptional regulator
VGRPEVRELLEGAGARLAAERLNSDSELDPLRKIQGELDAMGEPNVDSFATYLDINDAFHAEVVRLAKSDQLRQALDRLFSFHWFRLEYCSPYL